MSDDDEMTLNLLSKRLATTLEPKAQNSDKEEQQPQNIETWPNEDCEN